VRRQGKRRQGEAMRVYIIRDLTIEEPEVEGIVRRIYEEGL
jgi:ABC-type uncharacterized transport system ATPase subunit